MTANLAGQLAGLMERPLWLAPMAGVTDKAFRTMCLRHGAGLTYSEMISAKGLEYGNSNTWDLLALAPEEERIAVQLFGADPKTMAAQAAEVEKRLGSKLALIDVNMGCPVGKVVKKGEGSALMKTPELAAEIIARMVDAVDVPVTAKFRSGWAKGEVTAVEFAQRLEVAGASLLAVHGRSAKQMYSGKADWNVIKNVKDAVSVPVAGSGDVYTPEDVRAMKEQCGVDVVMAARGARGNPWIFEGRVPSALERINGAREHLELYIEFNGSAYLSPLRAQLAWYVHGMPGASDVRRALGAAETLDDYERIFADAEDRL